MHNKYYRKRIFFGFLSIGVLFVVGGFSIYHFVQTQREKPKHIQQIQELQNGLDLTVYDLKGRPILLSSFRPRFVLINFWATWCVPCVTELPTLKQLAQDFSGQLIVLAISNEKPKEIKNFLKNFKLPISFVPAQLSRKKMLSVFNVTALPETYILDKKGHLVEKIIGPQDWSSLKWKTHLQQLLEKS